MKAQETEQSRRQKQKDIAAKVIYDLTHRQPKLDKNGQPVVDQDGLVYEQTIGLSGQRISPDNYRYSDTHSPQYLRAFGIKVLAAMGLANISKLVHNETEGLSEWMASVRSATENAQNTARKIAQSEAWRNQGLCWRCGGKRRGLHCESCGAKLVWDCP